MLSLKSDKNIIYILLGGIYTIYKYKKISCHHKEIVYLLLDTV